jgi:hypothetical protein
MLSHAPSAVALHWHSRSVLTVTDAVPPFAGKVEADASAVTPHFDRLVGVVSVVPDAPHATTANDAVTIAAIAA